MTMAQIRKAGYEITRGDYQGTTDNNAGRWYIQRIEGPVDRRGRGYATRREARFALEDKLSESCTLHVADRNNTQSEARGPQ